MSEDYKGGLNYALLKRHYDCDDYPGLVYEGVTYLNGIPFTNTPTYYTSGLMAYLNDVNVVDVERGWTTFPHGQPAAPTYLALILTALGVTWPAIVPAFEAKDTLFWADQNCWLQFEGKDRVRMFLPANTYFRTQRRWFMIFVTRVTADGTLRVWING
jgi:hypothetical protein